MYTYPYPRPMVTVDTCIFCTQANKTEILLVQRKNEPFKNAWALPGGYVEMDEELEFAAARETEEETGITGLLLTQVKTYGTPGRDPRGRTISVVYAAQVSSKPVSRAGSDAKCTKWFDVMHLPKLAFDHQKIITEVLTTYFPNSESS